MGPIAVQLPNLISALRLAIVPVLLCLAWYGYERTVLALLVASFASDVLDGYLARRFGQTSTLGARLDSVGDFAVYLTIPLVGWWLWPQIVRREAPYLIAVIASMILPVLFGYCKFRTPTSYHTWATKLAALLIGGSVILLFAGWPAWLFHLATPVSVYAALEQMAITWVLPKNRSNVRSFWHARRCRSGRTHPESKKRDG